MNNIHPDLLKRYAEGKCSPEERFLVEEWLEKADDLPPDQEEMMHTPLKEEIWVGIKEHAKPSFKLLRPLLAGLVAASLLLLLGLFLFNRYAPGLPSEVAIAQESYLVPKGKMVTLKLTDGTSVQLAGGSSFRYPKDFSETKREVYLLSGEAFFTVKHDAIRPFIVHSSGTEVKVLGTKFNVQNSEGSSKLAVTLSEGSISFKGKNQQETLLKPGQQVVFNKQSDRIEKIEAVNAAYASSWTTGLLWFKNTTMTEVLRKLESYYGVTFEIQGNPDLKIPLTGKFQEQPLSRILKLIENSSELKFRQKADVIIIYK